MILKIATKDVFCRNNTCLSSNDTCGKNRLVAAPASDSFGCRPSAVALMDDGVCVGRGGGGGGRGGRGRGGGSMVLALGVKWLLPGFGSIFVGLCLFCRRLLTYINYA